MTTIKEIKRHLSKMNHGLINLSRKKLTAEEKQKYRVDSGLCLASDEISLLEERHIIFWVQHADYMRTSTHEEIKRINALCMDFKQYFFLVDTAIVKLQEKIKKLPVGNLETEATKDIEAEFEYIKTKYEALTGANKNLLLVLADLRATTLARPKKHPNIIEESTGNEAYLECLFTLLQEDLTKKLESHRLTDKMVKTEPAKLLINFIQSTLKYYRNDTAPAIGSFVRKIVDDLGGDEMISEAFNTDPHKKHGVLKSKVGNRLQKELFAFLEWLCKKIKEQQVRGNDFRAGFFGGKKGLVFADDNSFMLGVKNASL